jgi:hypothetical protein
MHAEKLTETVLHLNLDTLLCFGFLFAFLVFFLLMRQWQNFFWDTISRIRDWGTNTKIIKTETWFHLNLDILKIILFYFLKYFLFHLFLCFLSSLCLYNSYLAYYWVVHYLSLFISLTQFFFVCLFCLLSCFSLFLYFLCFLCPLTLPFLISPLLLLQARKYLIAHNTGKVTIPRAMKGRQKKQKNQFP